MVISHIELLLKAINQQWKILNAENPFYSVRNALSERFAEFKLNFVFISLRLCSKFEL